MSQPPHMGMNGGRVIRPKRVSRFRSWTLRVRRRVLLNLGITYAWWLRVTVWLVCGVLGVLVLGWAGAVAFVLLAEVVLLAVSAFNGRHLHR
jgi:hypothetical protein